MRRLDLRIKVRQHNNKLHIPRHVGGLDYDPVAASRQSEFLDGHEKLILGCLSRPFYVDEIFFKQADELRPHRKPLALVKLRQGPVLRRPRTVRAGLEPARHYVYFYVPVSVSGEDIAGFVEVRNVQSLFHRVTLIFPDIKVTTDLMS